MKKRIAYIGLSYPLLYDYRNQASRSKNDMQDSPNPIIESPLGLMILYDELWFLCESICPDNMRRLPYVKFVDELFPDLYYEGAASVKNSFNLQIDINRTMSFDDYIAKMNIKNWRGIDGHTHAFKIGDTVISGSGSENNLKFDIYIFQALQEKATDSIELVSNSRFLMNGNTESNRDAEAAERIIVPNIPNYLNKQGPYDPCMEELRSNQYLIDFRKWIIDNHYSIQRKEINEICSDVEHAIEETKDKVFNKYLEDNSKYAFYRSTGTTILKTGLGSLCPAISILDAITGISKACSDAGDVKSDRWQGFVINSRKIMKSNK